MEQRFWSYSPLPDPEVEQLWDTGFFAFDTSVLLALYQYSPTARTEFFDVLRGVAGRTWLPHQVGLEYHRRRVEVIHEQSQRYNEVIQQTTALNKQLDAAVRGAKGTEQVKVALRNLEAALKGYRRDQSAVGGKPASMGQDTILVTLNELFRDSRALGAPFDDDRLRMIYAEGKDRYARQIPPGFEDRDKPEPACYGDLVIWHEVLAEAKARNRGVILVINDAKPDWWRLLGREPYAPRAELREEFRQATGMGCAFYLLDRFLEEAKRYLKATVSEETIEEVRLSEAQDLTTPPITTFNEFLALRFPNLLKQVQEQFRTDWQDRIILSAKLFNPMDTTMIDAVSGKTLIDSFLNIMTPWSPLLPPNLASSLPRLSGDEPETDRSPNEPGDRADVPPPTPPDTDEPLTDGKDNGSESEKDAAGS